MSKTNLAMLLFYLLLGACLAEPVDRPFISPIIPNQVPVMLDNQWRLTELIYQGTSHDFDSIDPVLLTFHPGVFGYHACGGVGILSDTTDIEDDYEYRLLLGATGVGGDCSDVESKQSEIFDQALRATNRYKIAGDTLVLSGDQTRLTFVIDNEVTKPFY